MWGAPFTMAQKAQPAMRQAYFEHHRGVRSATDDPAATDLRDLRAQQGRVPRTLSRSRDAHHEAVRLRFRPLWEARSDRGTNFVYLLAWPDLAAKEAAWRAFMAD